ncbi:MAG: hypothetical protein Q9164_003395 [Protoblastenia rupestris]
MLPARSFREALRRRIDLPSTLRTQCRTRTVRKFHASPVRRTDGVYRDLTEMRVRTPWIDALRKQMEHGEDPTRTSDAPATPSNRNLKPKKMSDSFHRVT